MSTNHGDLAVTKEALEQAKALVEQGAAEAEQMDLFVENPITADELEDAREALGGHAGVVSVLREARKRRGGRQQGVRNRRTNDFARYIAQFGQDPAVTMMQIQSTPTEELVARSRLVDTPKRQMSYADAASLRIRCAEGLMAYVHSKQPIAVDATIRGITVVEEIGGAAVIEAEVEELEVMREDGDG
jgi:hypothetical protein